MLSFIWTVFCLVMTSPFFYNPCPGELDWPKWRRVFVGLNKIRGLSNMNGPELWEDFVKYDLKGTGKVHNTVFRHVVKTHDRNDWRMLPEELDAVVDYFTMSGTEEIAYEPLLHFLYCRCRNDAVCKRFREAMRWGITFPYREYDVKLNMRINAILDEINRRLKSLNIDYKSLFLVDCNENFTESYCHANMIYQSLKRAGISLSKEDFDLIVNQYDVGNKFLHQERFYHDLDMSYRRILKGVKTFVPQAETKKKVVVPPPRVLPGPGNFVEHDYLVTNWTKGRFTKINTGLKDNVYTIVSRIQKHVFQNERGNIHLIFKDFDKTHTGKISRTNFFSALDTMGVSITRPGVHILHIRKDELEDLADAYKVTSKPELVYWRKFMDDVLYVFGARPDPNERIPRYENFNPSLNAKYLEDRNPEGWFLTKEEVERACQIMKEVIKTVRGHNMNFAQFFEQFDKRRTEYISPTQFIRAMHCAGFPFDFKDGIIMSKFFSNLEGFSYLKFAPMFGDDLRLQWNELLEHSYFECQEIPEVIPTAPVPNEKLTFVDVLNKVLYTRSMRRLNLKYWWKEHDKRKFGYWNRKEFVHAMKAVYDWPLSQKEYEILMDGLADPFDKNIINYTLLLRIIDEHEVLPELEKAPLVQPLPNAFIRNNRRRKFSKEEYEALEYLWYRVSNYKKWAWKQWETAKGLKYVETLQTTSDHITYEKYIRALNIMGIYHLLTQYEIDLLFEVYSIDVDRDVRFSLKLFFEDAEQMYVKHRFKPRIVQTRPIIQ